MRNWAWALLLVLGFTTGVHASDAVRDYYEEPGLNPFKEDSGTKNFEFIDPFSGILQLKHLDISLPGNGGLDMNVYRTYNLPEGGIPEYSAFGLGWNMQPGRLVATTVSNDICAQINGTLPLNVDAKDNPAFELPDGSRKQFYRDAVQNNTQYISQDNWRLQCQVNTNSTTYVITSPSGTRYYATDISQSAGTNITSWFVTAIQDIHGNVIQIEYTTGYPGSVAVKLYDYRVMSRMTASDGREIDFSYANQGTLSVTLDTITVTQDSQTRTWQYSYTPLGTEIGRAHV